MSTELDDQQSMGTKPIKEHAWLEQLVGEWRTESEFHMGPDMPAQTAQGTESVKSLGGLWAVGEQHGSMPGGAPTISYFALGYDVTFKQYRGCWFGSMTSHLWKYEGDLSADGKTLTLNCVGPSFTKDGETANYRDVIEIIDPNHRTHTSYGEDDNGEWHEHMKTHSYRV